jgi:hypothetical protein
LNIDDVEEFPCLDVAISFGAIGNAPPLGDASVLRRTDPQDMVPYMLFILCAGSVCFQIDLMSDHLDDHIPAHPMGSINIRQSIMVDPEDGREPIHIDYGTPVHQNWSTSEIVRQPIESINLDFDPATSAGRFTPVFRKAASQQA